MPLFFVVILRWPRTAPYTLIKEPLLSTMINEIGTILLPEAGLPDRIRISDRIKECDSRETINEVIREESQKPHKKYINEELFKKLQKTINDLKIEDTITKLHNELQTILLTVERGPEEKLERSCVNNTIKECSSLDQINTVIYEESINSDHKLSDDELDKLSKICMYVVEICINERDTEARRLLTIIVLCRFVCLENAQYFARASHSNRAEKLFNEFANIFEELAVIILDEWGLMRDDGERNTTLENLSLPQYKKVLDEGTGKYIEKKVDHGNLFNEYYNEYAWNMLNIVDIARMGKMHKLIRSDIIDAHDEPIFNVTGSWPRIFRFGISLLLGGLPAPMLLKFSNEIFLNKTYWSDVKGLTYEHRKGSKNRFPTNKVPGDRERIEHDRTNLKYKISAFWQHWLIFHASHPVKLGYSFLSELFFMLYFSFYIRNCLLYKWNHHDGNTIAIVCLMMVGRLKENWPGLSMRTSEISKPFKRATHSFRWFMMLGLFFIAMVLRLSYTLMTPDEVFAPILESKKFSSNADVVLQNDDISFKQFNKAIENPARDIAYYRDIYKLSSSAPYDVRSHTSARQFDEGLAFLFFSYDPKNATNYECGLNMLNGLTLGAIIGTCHEIVSSISYKRHYIGYRFITMVIFGSIIGGLHGYLHGYFPRYFSAGPYSDILIVMFLISIVVLGLIFRFIYGSMRDKFAGKFGMNIAPTVFWFYSSLLAFFFAYPFYPIYQSLEPIQDEKFHESPQCDIR